MSAVAGKKVRFALLLFGALLMSACSSDDGAIDPPATALPVVPDQIDGTLELGSGVISPYKMLAWEGDPSRLLMVTGKGETFGQSLLHALDVDTLEELDTPLEVGQNASAIVWVGDRVLIATRSSGELFLVDPQRWDILDRIEIDIAAVGLVATSGQTAAVSSVSEDYALLLVSIAGDRIDIIGERTLRGYARSLAYDPSSDRLYAAGPNIGVETLDAQTLGSISSREIGGSLAFAAQVIDGHLLVTDRDGFVHAMNLRTQDVATFSLAEALDLNPLDVPLRGIDPLDLVVLDESRIAVLNQRRNSLVYRFDPAATPMLEPVAEWRAVGYGLWLPGRRELLWARSSADSVSRVVVPSGDIGELVEVAQRVGRRIIDAVALDGGEEPLLAVLDSRRQVTFVDAEAMTVGIAVADPGNIWSAPLASGPDGTLLLTGQAGDRRVVWHLDRDGTTLDSFDLSVTAYGLAAGDDRIIVTDRLNGAVQIIDTASRQSGRVVLARSRPRQSVALPQDQVLVIHDTNPDIGISILDAGLDVSFSDYSLSRWWSDLYPRGDGAAAVTFGGSAALFDADGNVTDSVLVNFDGVTHAAPAHNGDVWMVSQDLGSAIRVAVAGRAADDRLDYPDLIRLYEIGPDRVWLIGLRSLQAVSYRR